MLDRELRVGNLQSANAKKADAARAAVLRALDELVLSSSAINIKAVAEAAGVSRGFIYSHTELREQIAKASRSRKTKMRATSSTPNEASLAARLEIALDTIKGLKAENRQLKTKIENLAAQVLDQEMSN
ncbi:MAG: DUF6262 family protein [Arthrobacter sp.]